MIRTTVLAVVLVAAVAAACPAREEGVRGPADEADTLAAADLLPAAAELDGWKEEGGVLLYGPDDLWEYIDGQAVTFLMYDLRGAAVRRYLDAEGREYKIEVYEHGSPLMAFGIYSRFRSPEAEFIDMGGGGFVDEYSLHFWKGRFYVLVGAYDEGGGNLPGMKFLASTVAAGIPGGAGEPEEVSLFPPDGLAAGSVTFISRGVMGSGKLPPAFSGEYPDGDRKVRLYLFPLESTAAAGAAFEAYVEELGAEVEEVAAGEAVYEAAAGEVPYRGPVMAFRYAAFMGIVTGFEKGSGVPRRLAAETVALIRKRGGDSPGVD